MTKRKNKKSKRDSSDGTYLAIKSEIIRNKNIKEGLSKFKFLYSHDQIKRYFSKLNFDLPIFKEYICGNPFPQKMNELGKSHGLAIGDDIGIELFWHGCVISLFSNEINGFITLRDRYSYFLMHENYEDARLILDNIQNKYGLSIWLIESRISLMEIFEGLEKQKEYTNEIVRCEENDPLLVFLVSYISVRAEKNVSTNRYNIMIQDIVQDLESNNLKAIAEYVMCRLNFYNVGINLNSFPMMLYFESQFSIIDRYLMFIKICQLLISHDEIDESIEPVKQAISLIMNKIIDHKIDNIVYFLGLKTDITADEKTKDALNALDFYTTGKYESCKSLCERILSEEPCKIEIFELYVKSIIRLPNYNLKIGESYINKILYYMNDIIAKNQRTNESFFDLLKLIYVNSNQDWAAQLFAFLVKEYFSEEQNTLSTYYTYGELHSFSHNPIIGMIIKNKDYSQSYFSGITASYGPLVTIELLKAIRDNDIQIIKKLGIPYIRCKKYEAQVLASSHRYHDAINVYKEIIENGDIIIKQDAVLGLIKCFINIEDFNTCCDIMVDVYLENENIYTKLPLKRLMKFIESNESINFSENISIPIICDIYTRYVDSDKDFIKAIKYDDFLEYHGFSRPSEINRCISDFRIDKLIYFLRHICIFQVMDNSVNFNSSEEVERERILVCQLLINIDTQNQKLYSEEIRNITQKLMISKGIRQIENSKIYVDVDGVKKSIEKNLRESYNRYLSFLSNPSITDEPDYVTLDSDDYEGIKLQIPSNEKHGLFYAMVFEIRDHFVSSSKYGLDAYLSVGIRHGTLAGQLRGQFESYNLITQKNEETGIYYDNDYWKGKYQYCNSKIVIKIMKALGEFSKEIDKLIDVLKNKWIQIKTEDRNMEGLFNFLMPIESLEMMQSKASTSTKYEEFVDMVIEELWEMTEKSLVEVRFQVSNTLKAKFNGAFDILQQELDSIEGQIDLTELKSNINSSRTSLQYELDKIADWFKRVRTSEPADYTIDLAIDIALEMIRNIYPNKLISPELSIDSFPIFKGKTLKNTVDMFFILFDNILKHCQLEHTPYVKVNVERILEKIMVEVKNEIKPSIDIIQGNEKLSEIKAFIGNDNMLDNAKREGGTGFHKIEKILSVDMSCAHFIDFEMTKEHIFSVSIIFDIGGLVR